MSETSANCKVDDGYWISPTGGNHGLNSQPGDIWVSTSETDKGRLQATACRISEQCFKSFYEDLEKRGLITPKSAEKMWRHLSNYAEHFISIYWDYKRQS